MSKGRRLLFFFDGSSNRAADSRGADPTNAYKLNQIFTNGSDIPQISFYFSGVGTHGDVFSAITGEGFDDIVIEAYTNLASNYQEGDTIYLFGFSRGAAAARILSAMVSSPGLVLDTLLSAEFPKIWKLFTTNDAEQEQNRAALKQSLAGRLRPQPKIEFLGAFDTVPGYYWDFQKRFSKLRITRFNLEKHVKKAVQILAIDDNRLPSFAPLLWDKADPHTQTVEQIWMPGVHSDVGGHSNATFIGNLSLLTMIERVQHHCPELEIDAASLWQLETDTFDDEQHGIQITNERANMFFRFLLGYGVRTSPHNPGECKHELVSLLAGREVSIRGRKQLYEAKGMSDLPDLPSRYSDQVVAIVNRLCQMLD